MEWEYHMEKIQLNVVVFKAQEQRDKTMAGNKEHRMCYTGATQLEQKCTATMYKL